MSLPNRPSQVGTTSNVVRIVWIAFGLILCFLGLYCITLIRKFTIQEAQLQTYVELAAKTHASLNFRRAEYHFLVAEGTKTNISEGRGSVGKFKEIPVVSPWDQLYIKLYNQRMQKEIANASKGTNVTEGIR
jgi:hypothetical protein